MIALAATTLGCMSSSSRTNSCSACFPMNIWDGIEDASEMDGILDAHVSNT